MMTLMTAECLTSSLRGFSCSLSEAISFSIKSEIASPQRAQLAMTNNGIIIFMIEQTGPPLSLTISLLCFCGVLLLVIGVPILGLIARKDAGKSDTEDKL